MPPDALSTSAASPLPYREQEAQSPSQTGVSQGFPLELCGGRPSVFPSCMSWVMARSESPAAELWLFPGVLATIYHLQSPEGLVLHSLPGTS